MGWLVREAAGCSVTGEYGEAGAKCWAWLETTTFLEKPPCCQLEEVLGCYRSLAPGPISEASPASPVVRQHSTGSQAKLGSPVHGGFWAREKGVRLGHAALGPQHADPALP